MPDTSMDEIYGVVELLLDQDGDGLLDGHAMNLDSIRANLDMGHYRTHDGVVDDVRLVWTYCKANNQPDSEAFRLAEMFFNRFEKEYIEIETRHNKKKKKKHSKKDESDDEDEGSWRREGKAKMKGGRKNEDENEGEQEEKKKEGGGGGGASLSSGGGENEQREEQEQEKQKKKKEEEEECGGGLVIGDGRKRGGQKKGGGDGSGGREEPLQRLMREFEQLRTKEKGGGGGGEDVVGNLVQLLCAEVQGIKSQQQAQKHASSNDKAKLEGELWAVQYQLVQLLICLYVQLYSGLWVLSYFISQNTFCLTSCVVCSRSFQVLGKDRPRFGSPYTKKVVLLIVGTRL